MSTPTARELTFIGRPAARRPRSPQLEPRSGSSRDAAYRRLTAVVLRLDVATLATDLRAERRGRGLRHAA